MTRPIALVTGGTRGIGLGIAASLASRGFDLALSGLRAPGDVAPALKALAASGARVHYLRSDIASASDRSALVAGVIERYGRIDVLVNNAGRAPRVRADLLDASADSFAEVLATNLEGPYFLTQLVARTMIEQRASDSSARRAIVFITSISAEMASTERGEYCVSKAGLAMAVKLFAARLAGHGIPVFEVRPGVIDTDMTAPVRDVYDRRLADGLVPEGRWGTTADVGAAVAALATGDIPYATGSIICVDGGLHIPRL